jgi:hypothetical protein
MEWMYIAGSNENVKQNMTAAPHVSESQSFGPGFCAKSILPKLDLNWNMPCLIMSQLSSS